MGWYSDEELRRLGFSSVGSDVKLSKLASIYNAGGISIGSHVRIDDFCILSAGAGGIEIGCHVHIAAYCLLVGAGKITMGDFSSISSRVSVYSSTDDYSGLGMVNPTIPDEFRRVASGPVTFRRHTLVGSGGVILPGVELREGCSVGALSLVNISTEAFWLYAGIPARRVRERHRDILRLEREFLASLLIL